MCESIDNKLCQCKGNIRAVCSCGICAVCGRYIDLQSNKESNENE